MTKQMAVMVGLLLAGCATPGASGRVSSVRSVRMGHGLYLIERRLGTRQRSTLGARSDMHEEATALCADDGFLDYEVTSKPPGSHEVNYAEGDGALSAEIRCVRPAPVQRPGPAAAK